MMANAGMLMGTSRSKNAGRMSVFQSVVVPNPVAGAGAVMVVPAGLQWRVCGCNFSMVTGVAVAARIAHITAQDAAGHTLTQVFAAYAQPAGETAVYTFAPNVNNLSSTVDYVFLTTPMPEFVLGSGFKFMISFIGIQPTDQISGITLMVEASTPG